MVKFLVAHASKHGGTAEIANFIAGVIAKKSYDVDCLEVKKVVDTSQYDVFVLGTALYAGMWMGDMVNFMRQHQDILSLKATWIFASGPVGEGEPETLLDGDFVPKNIHPLLDTIAPNEVVLFHGKVDYQTLGWAERLILKAMNTPEGDFRDMESIQSWAVKVANESVLVTKP